MEIQQEFQQEFRKENLLSAALESQLEFQQEFPQEVQKEYSQRLLPHAKAQLQNFMLACIAEGKSHAEEEEQGY